MSRHSIPNRPDGSARSTGRGAIFMKKTALSVSGGDGSLGSCWRSVPRSSGPGEWPMAATRRIGVEPEHAGRDRDEPHRSPIALALSADGTRLLTANQTAGHASRWSIPKSGAGARTSSRPATSRRAWPSRKTAVAAWSPTGMATTWRARDQGRQDRGGRPRRGRARAAGRGASRPTARRPTWPSASATRSSAST